MPQRTPRNERIFTLDKNPEQLFKLWQQAGKIPPEYTSWQDLESKFKALVEGGLSEKEARKAMGVEYRNVEGANILQKNLSSSGETRYLNKRAIRTDVNVGTENHLRNRGGQRLVDAYRSQVKNDWTKLSKLEAQQMGVETGKQFHRGHVQAGLHGGSFANENMWPEHGMRNVMHGAEPRIPVETMRDLGIPLNETETFYERLLQKEGLPAAPRPDNTLMAAADEYMVQPQNGKAYVKPGDAKHNPSAGVNPNRLAALQDRMNQLEAQGVSRQALDNYARDLSGTLSTGDAVKQSGPARVVQKGRPKAVPYKTPKAKAAQAPKAIPTTQSYNAGLPGLGKRVGNLVKDNLGGAAAGLGIGLMTDPELHQAVTNGDALKAAAHVATDAVSGAASQAAVKALPVAAAARVASVANPVGAAILAASAPSSTDQGKQRERLMEHVNRLPAKKREQVLAEIKQDDAAAAKPLIDGNALLRQGVKNVQAAVSHVADVLRPKPISTSNRTRSRQPARNSARSFQQNIRTLLDSLNQK